MPWPQPAPPPLDRLNPAGGSPAAGAGPVLWSGRGGAGGLALRTFGAGQRVMVRFGCGRRFPSRGCLGRWFSRPGSGGMRSVVGSGRRGGEVRCSVGGGRMLRFSVRGRFTVGPERGVDVGSGRVLFRRRPGWGAARFGGSGRCRGGWFGVEGFRRRGSLPASTGVGGGAVRGVGEVSGRLVWR